MDGITARAHCEEFINDWGLPKEVYTEGKGSPVPLIDLLCLLVSQAAHNLLHRELIDGTKDIRYSEGEIEEIKRDAILAGRKEAFKEVVDGFPDGLTYYLED